MNTFRTTAKTLGLALAGGQPVPDDHHASQTPELPTPSDHHRTLLNHHREGSDRAGPKPEPSGGRRGSWHFSKLASVTRRRDTISAGQCSPSSSPSCSRTVLQKQSLREIKSVSRV